MRAELFHGHEIKVSYKSTHLGAQDPFFKGYSFEEGGSLKKDEKG